MPSYKLTYFNGRGRAETTRMCFGVGKIKFEDCRIEQEDWPNMKADTPWGTLPVLEVDGKKFGQSKATARLAARIAGLAGKNEGDAAIADAIVYAVSDVQDVMFGVMFASDDDKAAKMQKMQDALKNTLPKIEKILEMNNGGKGFLVGKDITWADLHFYQFMDQCQKVDEKCLANNPKLKDLYARIGADARLKAYLKDRPETPF